MWGGEKELMTENDGGRGGKDTLDIGVNPRKTVENKEKRVRINAPGKKRKSTKSLTNDVRCREKERAKRIH